MRPLSKRERTERVLTALACNICPTDDELDANIRKETCQYDRRIARQRAAREEFERRHGKKPV